MFLQVLWQLRISQQHQKLLEQQIPLTFIIYLCPGCLAVICSTIAGWVWSFTAFTPSQNQKAGSGSLPNTDKVLSDWVWFSFRKTCAVKVEHLIHSHGCDTMGSRILSLISSLEGGLLRSRMGRMNFHLIAPSRSSGPKSKNIMLRCCEKPRASTTDLQTSLKSLAHCICQSCARLIGSR